ncbi:MAG: hypothetical protein OXF27_20010 [Acidobacteria bacterium]|nr:hypothetical protein [Acidobacteriota bacterium]
MANTPNPRTIFLEQLLYRVYLASFWAQLFNPMWLRDFESGTSWEVASLIDNVVTDAPADADALETAIAGITTASTDKLVITRAFIRGAAQWNPVKVSEQVAGGDVEAQLLDTLATKLALDADEKLEEVATAAANFTAGRGNQVGPLGDAGNIFIPRAAPYTPTGDKASYLPFQAMRMAHLRLYRANAIGGDVIGAGHSDRLVHVMPPELADVCVGDLEDRGELVDRASIAAEAGVELGIYGTSAYMGSYARGAIMASNSLTVPTGNGNWRIYTVPVEGPLAGRVGTPSMSDERWADGNTGGEMRNTRHTVIRWAGAAMRPEHIIESSIHAD